MKQPSDVTPQQSLESGTTRRQFCAFASKAASFVAVSSLTAACGGSPSGPSGIASDPAPSVPATLTGRTVTIVLDAAPALSSVGAGAIAFTSLGSFLVARTGQNTYTALSSTCTHEACEVSAFGGGRFVCPCHGSQYSTSGAVVTGPATRALSQFSTQVNGNVLSFTV